MDVIISWFAGNFFKRPVTNGLTSLLKSSDSLLAGSIDGVLRYLGSPDREYRGDPCWIGIFKANGPGSGLLADLDY